MKLFTFYTDTHEPLLREVFLPSLIDGEYELCIKKGEQMSETGSWNTDGYIHTIREKTEIIFNAIEESWGERFLFCDVDLVFFGPTREVVLREADGYDMAMQWHKNAGFFVCHANERTHEVWRRSLELIKQDPDLTDEAAFRLVQRNWDQSEPLGGFKFKHLSDRFLETAMVEFADGKKLEDCLESHEDLINDWAYNLKPPPDHPDFPLNGLRSDTLVFHAIYCVGVENKIVMLNRAKEYMQQKFALASQAGSLVSKAP